MAETFFTLNTGAKFPALGLGTCDTKSDEDVEIALNRALEAGYRHIDTALAYGNEAPIGRVLKKLFSSGKIKREELFINTKLPMIGIHPDRVEMFMKQSLANLQLDYVDSYLVHFPVGVKYHDDADPAMGKPKENGEVDTEPKTDHAAIWRKMEDQVDAGRAKAIGLSNYNIPQIETILKTARIKPAILQIENHLYLQQRELVDFCQRKGIQVVAFTPLAKGETDRFFQKIGQDIEVQDLPTILSNPVVGKIAKNHSKSTAQIALRFLVQRGIVAIPRAIILQQVRENIDIFNFKLTEDEMKALYALDVGEKARVCDWSMFKGINKHPDFPFPV